MHLRSTLPPLLVLLVGLGVAWRQHREAVTAGTLRPVSSGDFVPGRESRHVAYVDAIGLPDPRIVVEENGIDVRTVYIVLAEPTREGADSVRLVAAVREDEIPRQISHDTTTGLVGVRGIARLGLDERTAASFRSKGLIPAARVWVVTPALDPGRMERGAAFAAAAAVVGALAVFLILRLHRHPA